MSGLFLVHLKSLVVVPTLAALPAGYSSQAAVNLLTGIALVESGAEYLAQIGGGPAIGLWQMEPATHDDCWDNFIRLRPSLVTAMACLMNRQPEYTQLQANLAYACAMARIKIMRAPEALPDANDAPRMSAYHKEFYNTCGGSADSQHNIPVFQQAIDA
jgi:hypothetical protein